MAKKIVAVIGDSEVEDEEELDFAERLGFELAKRGYVVLTGGLGGIMEAVSKGAKKAGGITVGIIPMADKSFANEYVDIVIPTGMGWTRNSLVALTADLVIAIGGKSGTLTELAYAWMYNKPIIAVKKFGGWAEHLADRKIDGRREDVIYGVETVEEAIKYVERLLR